MGYEHKHKVINLDKKTKPEKVSYKVMTDKDRRYVVRRAKKSYSGTWRYAVDSAKDAAIEKQCKYLGYTLVEFYAADGKFLNKILDR